MNNWYNEGGYIPPGTEACNGTDKPETVVELPNIAAPGFWVLYFVGDEVFIIEGVFSSLYKARHGLHDYYEPRGLSVKMNSWAENLVGVVVSGLDSDGDTELEMQFYIEYKELDEFKG